jgi:serine/threonine protein kinase
MSITYAVPNSKRYPIENDYEIKDQLGDGQYSVVKMGVNKQTSEEVAIKIIHRSQTETYEFLNEVELMREVSDHPGFIRLIDVYEDDKNYTLIMELVRGGELFDKIAQLTTYNEERVAALLNQIVSALAYLHSKKIVHRDIKPENLLFVDENASVIKLCDFGVAEKIPERGYLTEVIGTESYMAPEVEAGQPYGVSSDMYGLGVIMYIMLCGYPPFEPENGIVDLEFPEEEWSDISPVVKDLITTLLEHEPSKRPTAQEVLKNPWIRGETAHKEELQDTIKTMKIFNHYRNSGNFGSMREAKANKKEAVWSIFSNTGNIINKRPKNKIAKIKKNDSMSNKKKLSSKDLNGSTKGAPPKKVIPKKSDSNTPKPKSPPYISPRTSQSSSPKFVKREIENNKPSEELQLDAIDHTTKDPEELQQTISLLESKLVSLSNINCALQSQIDEISCAYDKLKVERDELKKNLDEVVQEIETFRKIEKKKKEKKN